jgi:hypothetical protein
MGSNSPDREYFLKIRHINMMEGVLESTCTLNPKINLKK